MKPANFAATLFTVALAAVAQQPAATLGSGEASQAFDRAVQLMESVSIAIPDLSRAGAPLVENVRMAAKFLHDHDGHLPTTYTLLTNLRAFLLLADSVAKPYPFPDEAAKQLTELRDLHARIGSHFAALLESRETSPEDGPTGAMRFETETGFGTVSSGIVALSQPGHGERRWRFPFASWAPETVPWKEITP